jgi:CRISPR-associated protein Cas5a/b/c
MISLLVEGIFHWGFSVRYITESAGSQQYPVPPPSTLIGALAYGLSAVKGLPEFDYIQERRGEKLVSGAYRLRKAVLWATFSFTSGNTAAVEYSDFIRSFRLIYQRGTRHTWDQKDMWFAVSASGKVYACNSAFKALYLFNSDELQNLRIKLEDLIHASFSIVRIGSRESLVSIKKVTPSSSIEEVKAPLETEYYFPLKLANSSNVNNYSVAVLPKLSDALWEVRPMQPPMISDHEEYYLPATIGPIKIPGRIRVDKLNENAVALKINFDHSSELVIVPREVVERWLR